LAHGGVLFLDELPEFHRATLEALRQPLESGRAVIARANHHVTYPARVQLVAAMNPCRCGYLGDPERSCRRVPLCARDYQSKISGPLLDRIDLVMDVDAVAPADLARAPAGEPSRRIAARVAAARERQAIRLAATQPPDQPHIRVNAAAEGTVLERITQRTPAAEHLLREAAERMSLSARGYHRILRVARTITDLDPNTDPTAPIEVETIAEALSYRRRMGL
jgi:magnesium chelatase family protein